MAAGTTLAAPAASGVINGTPEPTSLQNPTQVEAFEVVSIKPSGPAPAVPSGRGGGVGPSGPCSSIAQVEPRRLVITSVTLYRLIVLAYGLKNCAFSVDSGLISGGPDWVKSDGFDIQALLPEGSPTYTRAQFASGDVPKLQLMLQALLADRFKLVLHRETKDVPVYNLVVVRPGKMKVSEDQTPPGELTPPRGTSGTLPRGVMLTNPRGLSATAVPISNLVNWLEINVGRRVIDKTDLKGLFDVSLQLEAAPIAIEPGGPPPRLDFQGSIFSAIQEQLGLKLESARGPGEFLVIDNANRPTPN
jgi:uncharacterized protein (TIGR03435 family)